MVIICIFLAVNSKHIISSTIIDLGKEKKETSIDFLSKFKNSAKFLFALKVVQLTWKFH